MSRGTFSPRRIALILTTSITACVAAHHLDLDDKMPPTTITSPPPPISPKSASHASTAGAMTSPSEDLEMEIELVRQQLVLLSQQQQRLAEGFELVVQMLESGQVVDQPAMTSIRSSSGDDRADPSDEAEQAEVHVRERTVALDDRLAQEPSDSRWATDAEAKIGEGIESLVEEGASMEEMRCAATLCRVSIRFSSEHEANRSASVVAGLGRWSSERFFYQDARDPNRVVAYIGREGESLGGPG